jgi:hypothetical protein
MLIRRVRNKRNLSDVIYMMYYPRGHLAVIYLTGQMIALSTKHVANAAFDATLIDDHPRAKKLLRRKDDTLNERQVLQLLLSGLEVTESASSAVRIPLCIYKRFPRRVDIVLGKEQPHANLVAQCVDEKFNLAPTASKVTLTRCSGDNNCALGFAHRVLVVANES